MTLKVLDQPILENTQSTPLETEIDSLGAAAQFSIFAIRVWSSAKQQRLPIEQALGGVFAEFRCTQVLDIFDECMSLLAIAALRKVSIGCCPSNKYVVGDEAIVLDCLRELEKGNADAASAIMDVVIVRALRPTFCRTAKIYTDHLNQVGLDFKPPRSLALV
jgi:hypothetical protein